MSNEELLIVGLGSVGSVLAIRFQLIGYNIIAKTSIKGNERIRNNGLLVALSNHKPVLYEGEVYAQLPQIYKNRFTKCIVATKSYVNPIIASDLLNFLTNNASILLFQNGLSIEQPFISVNPSWKVTRAVSSIGATRNGHKVTEVTIGDTIIGPINYSNSTEVHRWLELLTEAGLSVKISTNIERDIWLKGIANSVINPLGAITGLQNKAILEDPFLKEYAETLTREIVSILPQDLEISFDDAWNNIVRIINKTRENKCSMLQDIEAQRKTEIDYLNGIILKMAEEQGNKAQYNRQVVNLIKGLESGEITTLEAVLNLRSS